MIARKRWAAPILLVCIGLAAVFAASQMIYIFGESGGDIGFVDWREQLVFNGAILAVLLWSCWEARHRGWVS
jgi:hypothetical protein